MTEAEQILTYLNRYYRINENKFHDIENDIIEYGDKIVGKLNIIFSINEDVCSVVLVSWAENLGVTTELIKAAWIRPNLFRSATYEPKRKNRFIVTFPSYYNIQQWVIKEASRPSMYFEVKKFLGFQYSKKMKWKPITFILTDPIGPSTSQSLMELIRPGGYLTTPFNITIKMLDPTGVVVENWNIINATIDSVDFGQLDIALDELATCKLTVNVPEVNLLF